MTSINKKLAHLIRENAEMKQQIEIIRQTLISEMEISHKTLKFLADQIGFVSDENEIKETAKPVEKRIPMQYILQQVCDITGVALNEMRGHSRQASKVKARVAAAYLMAKYTHMSYPSIGKILNKDGSSVYYYLKKMNHPKTNLPVMKIVDEVVNRRVAI